MSDMQEAVTEFLIESYENLDQLDNDLIALEEHPDDTATLASIFRTIHTIKGTCGFLGFSTLESVTHVGENLLGKLRDGAMSMDEAIADALLKLVDAVRQMLAHIESTGADGDGDYTDLIQLLDALLAGEPAATATDAGSAPAAEASEVGTPDDEDDREADADPDNGDAEPCAEVLAPPATPKGAAPAGGEEATGSVAASKVRVDVGQLDVLMNLVGELVLARNQILQFQGLNEDSGFLASTQRLNLITTELQEGVMKTRMQPIGVLWSKYPRVVRDLAKACGKQLDLELQGKETELDKTILEAVKDPLTHIVRNSVDHGIEPPEARRAAGKPATGTLLLRAFHEGGQVNIEISDDGGGLNLKRIKAKALEKGVVTTEQVRHMSDSEACQLIFAPGFSTAKAVTNVSGRGVGMDVVRTNIEKIGGSVDVQTVEGKGTTIRIKIPLTLAIIPALTITSGAQRFAIPQVNLLELVRIENQGDGDGIEYVHGTPVHRLRGKLLPLVYLNEQLGLETPVREDLEEEEAVSIVVLNADGHAFGLIVDEINDTEEIVVKPLGKQLKELEVYAGATIMGDGCVALILDAVGLARRGGILEASGYDEPRRHISSGEGEEKAGEQSSLLLFSIADGVQMAIPLSAVSRLEEVAKRSVEVANGRPVIQYRDEIMPLIHLPEYFGHSSDSVLQTHQLIVYQYAGHSVGLVVRDILDIVDDAVVSKRSLGSNGVLGSVVIRERVTDLIDADAVIEAMVPELAETQYAA
jgi:two-component system chemotaxis sensor kinase CheA